MSSLCYLLLFKHIDGIPATHPVSTKPKKAKFSHYDEIKDEPGVSIINKHTYKYQQGLSTRC